MRVFIFLFIFLNTFIAVGQYHFSGQVSKENEGRSVYLSLIEDYRKSSRIYLDQIIQETVVDSLGYFQFEGNNLFTKNRVYQLHLDGCSNELKTNHFLGQCDSSTSLLFIANNKDAIQFPTSFENQALCTITSTNAKSSVFLEIDALKEEMIFEFMDYNSESSASLNLKKWFKRLQDFAERSDEPLAELYIYDFLSDRKNETHTFYMMDVKFNGYYDELLTRLMNKYPNAPFTLQYENELNGDKLVQHDTNTTSPINHWKYILYGGILFLILQVAYFNFKRREREKKKNPFDLLTVQERNIMTKISEGKSNKEIASELFISLSTVKTHINNLYKKLDVSSRNEIKSML
ncbi:helix-turn-helix transcriptional regulator [Flagellimonas aquimarina]|uniref:Helix-turn-helix transcriptional regulator n=1 Tax=Flagellimonas aquimarina TaxID=2201895 RepID=A0A316L840_9FLAO|nr:LuxR C-terminal-related transcriptional regulator [Allomuricauda koreensis]PWL40473.1 helix-turn-helix transcriptional regulator [Allomuricauda koreensis]